MSKIKKIILEQPWGGLGDNLQFTTLPELCHENGYEFYLSDKNSYRNLEIKKLVWDTNPFVLGVSSDPPNAGHINLDSYSKLVNQGYSLINAIEMSHGFEPKNSLPKLYYKPNNIEFYNDKTVICLATVTESYDNEIILSTLEKLLNKEDKVIELNTNKDLCELNKAYGHHIQYTTHYKKIFMNDIFEHCDIIFSAKKYICLFSGNSVLSAAIGKKNTFVLTNFDLQQLSKSFYFNNLEYIKL
jgi:hypothetical protein